MLPNHALQYGGAGAPRAPAAGSVWANARSGIWLGERPVDIWGSRGARGEVACRTSVWVAREGLRCRERAFA
jgi:hypothetical protein